MIIPDQKTKRAIGPVKLGDNMIRIYALIFLASLAGGAYYYYQDTQERLAQAAANLAVAEQAAKQNQMVIDNMQQQYAEQQEMINELNGALMKANANVDKLRNTLQNHDLARLALKKPGLIEKRINDATAKLFEELEAATAVEPTDTAD